jgi:membrane-bound acyltransferase YfiQ involved in biofilm formation
MVCTVVHGRAPLQYISQDTSQDTSQSGYHSGYFPVYLFGYCSVYPFGYYSGENLLNPCPKRFLKLGFHLAGTI